MESGTDARQLSHIRDTLGISISNLASAFGVPDESIYGWLNGVALPNYAVLRLNELAQALAAIDLAGFAHDRSLLKRRIIGGKTMLQALQAGKSIQAAIPDLIAILQREALECERLAARLEGRVIRTPSVDFDFPEAD